MLTISQTKHDGFEQVVGFSDTDFQCYIAIHNTVLGTALGGCRIRPYASRDEAVADAMRLAKGMTYKSSLAGLDFGGGKCVVVAEKATREIMLRVGEAVNYFTGRYITAEDVGTHLTDIQIVAEVCPYTVHLDGSAMTARGVLACMQAAVRYQQQWGDQLHGIPIWVQGLGKVGMDLAERICRLIPDDLNLMVSDLRTDLVARAEALGARGLTEADKRFVAIYAPCAMGQVITAENVDKVNHSIICGSANNQLADDSYAEILHQRDVLYVPDFLANAGGIVNAHYELANKEYDLALCEEHTDYLGEILVSVLTTAKKENSNPLIVAKRMAEERFT